MEKPVLESLNLFGLSIDPGDNTVSASGHSSSGQCCACLMCDEWFNLEEDSLDTFLRHLLTVHKVVIADVKLICNLKRYMLYWKERLKELTISDICSVINTNTGSKDVGPKEQYYLLSDILPEDKKLREFLQKRNLETVLQCQQKERDDTNFSRMCLFCREHFTGNRALLFDHMAHDHNFNVGLPDNLVYTDEFLDKLQEKLNSLQCLYCEKVFKDRNVLKEHMRKKQHKKINPKNSIYDKYYIINYLSEDDTELETEDETDSDKEEWESWQDVAGSQAVCLYCEFSSGDAEKLQLHMQELHDLDLKELKLRLNLNFYQQVKLINYIRRQVHLFTCIGCQTRFDNKRELIDHMHQEKHTDAIPDTAVWDQPQYFFPTYENDNLLCQLEDNSDTDEQFQDSDLSGCHGNISVIAEDNPVTESILAEESIRKEILSS
ncbi:hypothetical protein KUTeg_021299 [Tegillarca granosa]|uniref:C2H2-type domain-containing protein n=1 Tax=Tegillarca granosa TaxID=220873 RepID=A0ABQ9EEH7_TEGGR|nr:hypothetical protein KUTeg_021299 [Tegillarca granosa]